MSEIDFGFKRQKYLACTASAVMAVTCFNDINQLQPF